MQRLFAILLSIFVTFNLYAQDSATTPIEESRPITEYLSTFTAIDVDAPIRLTLTKIGNKETPYIIYDTKGVYTSKFVFEIDRRTSTLKISERSDPKRTSITEVHVFFNSLTDISISKANVTVEGTISSELLDLYISNDANLVIDVDVLDLVVYASGKSRIEISGSTHYQTADISTAEYSAQGLGTISTVVEATHNAIVRVDASERLQAKTATGGKIYYYTQPVIYRSEVTTFGGEIVKVQ